MTEPGPGTDVTQGRPGPGARSGVLERPWIRRKLILDLAKGEDTQRQLATRYGVAHQAISAFKRRHLPEVKAALEQLADEFVGLWVAEKQNRLAAYQEDLESIEDLLRAGWSGNAPADMAELLRIKHRALRQVAEEVGQLPSRIAMHVDNRVAHYSFGVGISMDDLQ